MMNYIKILAFLLIGFSFACNDEQATEEPARIISTGNPKIDDLSGKIMAHPEDHKLYAERAVEYYKMEGYDEAIADMAVALQKDSNNVEYHYLLSDVYLNYYKSGPALRVMERAVEIEPENITSLLKLARIQLTLKQHEPSLKSIDRVLKINKNTAEAFVLMGMNFEMNGDNSRAINAFQTAIETDPSLSDVHMKLGQLFAKNDNDIALRYFDNAVAANPNNMTALYAKAEYLHNNDKLDEALETLKQVIINDHQFVDAYFRTGVIYLEKDSLQKAYDQFNFVIQNDPASPKGFYYRGLAAQLKGDPAKAKRDYEQALVFSPGYQKAKDALERLK